MLMYAAIHLGFAQCLQPGADQPLLAFGQIGESSSVRSGLLPWLRARSSKHPATFANSSKLPAPASAQSLTPFSPATNDEAMKQPFVHRAEIILDVDADSAAPGGAVTIALCGSWDHAGACRWPHYSQATWGEGRGELRVVFVADAGEEAAVRNLIDKALTDGCCIVPDGTTSRWTLVASSAVDLNKRRARLGSANRPASPGRPSLE
jgi:hypothetical protein